MQFYFSLQIILYINSIRLKNKINAHFVLFRNSYNTNIALFVNLFMEYLLNTNKLIKEIIDALPDNYLRQERDCIPTMFTWTNRTRQQN